jgi:hypothetical protein|eukprot:SAG25_NODE_2066_length_1990_cov_1.567953_2_plen_73_part_00
MSPMTSCQRTTATRYLNLGSGDCLPRAEVRPLIDVAGHETTLLAKLVIAQSKCRLMVGHSGWGSEKSGSSQP